MNGRSVAEGLSFIALVLGVAAFPVYLLLFAKVPG